MRFPIKCRVKKKGERSVGMEWSWSVTAVSFLFTSDFTATEDAIVLDVKLESFRSLLTL